MYKIAQAVSQLCPDNPSQFGPAGLRPPGRLIVRAAASTRSRKIGERVGMPNGHNGQRNGAGGPPADHFAHSRRRIENNEVTLDTIAGSLLRIFVRIAVPQRRVRVRRLTRCRDARSNASAACPVARHPRYRVTLSGLTPLEGTVCCQSPYSLRYR